MKLFQLFGFAETILISQKRILDTQERILKTMATQADVDAITSELQASYNAINSKLDALTQELAAQQANQNGGNTIDLTNLHQISDELKALTPQSAPAIPASDAPSPANDGQDAPQADASAPVGNA